LWGWANPAVRPNHGFEQPPASLFVPERFDHIGDRSNSGKDRQHSFGHRKPPTRWKPSQSHKMAKSQGITVNLVLLPKLYFERIL